MATLVKGPLLDGYNVRTSTCVFHFFFVIQLRVKTASIHRAIRCCIISNTQCTGTDILSGLWRIKNDEGASSRRRRLRLTSTHCPCSMPKDYSASGCAKPVNQIRGIRTCLEVPKEPVTCASFRIQPQANVGFLTRSSKSYAETGIIDEMSPFQKLPFHVPYRTSRHWYPTFCHRVSRCRVYRYDRCGPPGPAAEVQCRMTRSTDVWRNSNMWQGETVSPAQALC